MMGGCVWGFLHLTSPCCVPSLWSVLNRTSRSHVMDSLKKRQWSWMFMNFWGYVTYVICHGFVWVCWSLTYRLHVFHCRFSMGFPPVPRLCTRNRLGCARENNLVVHADEGDDDDADDDDDGDDDENGDDGDNEVHDDKFRFWRSTLFFPSPTPKVVTSEAILCV